MRAPHRQPSRGIGHEPPPPAAKARRGRAPVRVGLIGAGKFGSMFLNQAPSMAGIEIVGHRRSRPRSRSRTLAARSDGTRRASPAPGLSPSGIEACADPDIEVVVEATGSPPAGIAHARAAIAAGKHIVMVNVEADVLAGPLLAEEARAKGVVYSLAYGDQPALTCELVDWARACGFEVAAAGKGTKYLPEYHTVTPDEVWQHYGLTPEEARARRHEPADVQLVSRRHQIRDRDGGDRQRHRPWRCRRTACASRPAASTTCRKFCAAGTRAARWSATAWSRSSRRWSATEGRCFATCVGVSMSCSKAPNDVCAHLL